MKRPSVGAVYDSPAFKKWTVWSEEMTLTVRQPVESIEIVSPINRSFEVVALNQVFFSFCIAKLILNQRVVLARCGAFKLPKNHRQDRPDNSETRCYHEATGATGGAFLTSARTAT